MEDRLEEVYEVSKEDLEGLINKGLIKFLGYDPLGRPVYANTELGNEIAAQLDKMEEENVSRTKRKARTR